MVKTRRQIQTCGTEADRQSASDSHAPTPPEPVQSSTAADRAALPSERPPSPSPSARSTTSVGTIKLRREMQLRLDLEAAEKEAEIEKRLIARKRELETKALLEMPDDEVKSLSSNSTTSLSRFIHARPDPTMGSQNPQPSRHPLPSRQPLPPLTTTNTHHQSSSPNDNLAKFIARQTCAKDLPPFTGNPEEWPLFYSQFKTSTEICLFSEEENVARLWKCLGGRAREAVSSLLISGGNLRKIIDTLKLRFGRPEYIIEIMLSKIRNAKFIRHDDINGMIDFATQVQNVVETMRVTDELGHISNPNLMRELIQKLPSSFKYQWSFHITNNMIRPDLIEFSEWLMSVANSAIHVAPLNYMPPEAENAKYRNTHVKTVLATTSSSTRTCAFCNDAGHTLPDCKQFKSMNIDDRWKFVTGAKLCFCCLVSNHQIKTCKRKARCPESGCERLHHHLLHALPLRNDSATGNPNQFVLSTISPVTGNVLLKILPVTVQGPRGNVQTLALLDEGASISLASNSLLKRAGIDGPIAALDIAGASGMRSTERDSRIVSFNICGVNNSDVYCVNNVRSVNNLNINVNTVNFDKLVNMYPYVADYVTNFDSTRCDIELLLGQDNIDLIATRELILTGKNGPYISKTRLGYVVHGNVRPNCIPTDATILHLCACDDLNHLVKQFYSTDSFGTKLSTDTPRSREDQRALAIMERTTKLTGDRWETGLLWKDVDAQLPDSYAVAKTRLDGVLRKMRRMPEFAARYREKFQENLEKGYVSKLSDSEQTIKTSKTWYLPHFAVFNPNKPNKLRLVLDCAAKSSGKSLNDFLHSGPDLLASLTGIILNFRVGKVAVMGDIQEMFHRVLIREEDRQAQRLLWEDGEYVMNVMTFGAVCSPSSSQYVKNLNATRFQETHPRAVKAIVEHHYVDDYILSLDTIEEAIEVTDDVIQIHALGGFNLRNFMSNSKEVLMHLPSDKLAPSGVKFLSDDRDQDLERVLGVRWDPENDEFTFQLKLHKIAEDIKSGIKRPTKRDVLKLIMSVFDPLGILLYVIVSGRILLQDIWKTKTGWDDEIETSLFDKWTAWLKELKKVEAVKVPRWMGTLHHSSPESCIQIHVFADASSKAFAATSYLRLERPDGTYVVTFIIARARVAPLKTLSIPRLELQAAVMAARLSSVLRKYIPIATKIFFWSDSKTVLSWLRSDSGRFKPFVAHRISEITELTDVRDWRWVPTLHNPADDATRDTAIGNNDRWLSGPDFLRKPENCWPVEELEASNDFDDVEMKKNWVGQLTASSAQDSLVNCSRFSKYWRLIRCVAWVRRFAMNTRPSNRTRQQGELTAQEISEAERTCIRDSQARSFAADIRLLKTDKSIDNDSPLRTLSPFLDEEGVLRIAGRIDAADVDNDTKRPIILHPKDGFTRLLIHQYHKDAAHCGRELVLNNLRKKYWVINGRSAVKSIWNECQQCKNQRAKPTPPMMGQLPHPRLKAGVRPFLYTGLDYFGPLTVKVGRRHEKRYAALFTCLSVRAVHIEIVHDLTTSSAIMAIRRFAARRGCPKEIWCDNATTFRGAATELKHAVSAINRDELLLFGSTRGIEWKFIPPLSPHMGGCWERLVRSVKVALRNTLKERTPTDQTLSTLLAEAEWMVNSRPLTHVPIDDKDQLPLTPNDFLLQNAADIATPFGAYDDADLIRKGWRESQRLTDLLWKRWVHEYLPTLTRRDKWFRVATPLAIGDMVVIADDQMPRNSWVRGIIKQVFPGRDGQVRVADVETGQTVYRRPATKLCKLDVHLKD